MSYQNGSIMAQKSKQLDPRFADFDEFADQLSKILAETNDPKPKRRIRPVIEKPVIVKRFFIELKMLQEFLLRGQFNHEEAEKYRRNFPLLKLPGEITGTRELMLYRKRPVYSRHIPEIVLFLTQLTYKLEECCLKDMTPLILERLQEEVRRLNGQPLEKVLGRVYRHAFGQTNKYLPGHVKIKIDEEKLKHEMNHPPTRWYRYGKTHLCKCGWKGVVPVVAGFGGFTRPIRYFCPVCKKEMRK